jgi:hypothetical protein
MRSEHCLDAKQVKPTLCLQWTVLSGLNFGFPKVGNVRLFYRPRLLTLNLLIG